MTPEERLDRLEAIVTKLGERTDAVAQSVELLARMQIDAEKRTARLDQALSGSSTF